MCIFQKTLNAHYIFTSFPTSKVSFEFIYRSHRNRYQRIISFSFSSNDFLLFSFIRSLEKDKDSSSEKGAMLACFFFVADAAG